ncbi:MAG: NPCBM/NEW2 domain-containing protein [Armatimonadota bacterium]
MTLCSIALSSADSQQKFVRLDELDLSKVSQEWGSPKAGRSVENKQIRIGGKQFDYGLGTHAESGLIINLKGSAVRFEAFVGVDDELAPEGSVTFEIWVDDKLAASTGVMKSGDKPLPISVDLTGASTILLMVTGGENGINGDHADWADAKIFLAANAINRPESISFIPEPAPVVAQTDPNKLSINGPHIIGTTPGRRFLFLIPATGEGKLKFSAQGLPENLKLDMDTGTISGTIKNAGEYKVKLTVEDQSGHRTSRALNIIAGNQKLALTPPMGWNSWNVWGLAVDDAKVRQAADWIVKSGLAAHGYQYINIDDGWQKGRDENGKIIPNEKFPDMKALADYVHSKGLKIGIYSSPGSKTCGGFEGSYQHEEQDAQTYAEWGMDYLKYDLCSYSDIMKDKQNRTEMQKPYIVMRDALDKVNQDIIYNLCQYGWYNVWEWGEEIGGNCWRTTSDIIDTWGSMSSIGFNQYGREKYAGPGHWNDLDMLVVGKVGWGLNIHQTQLSPNEQLTHVTLWSLLSAPMLLGCDMSQLDQFTLNILTNDEVLAINQDPMGVPTRCYVKQDHKEVWARPLSTGTFAVGLFNRGLKQATVEVKWSDLGINGPQKVRDMWQRKDIGVFSSGYSTVVPAHGVALFEIGTPAKIN